MKAKVETTIVTWIDVPEGTDRYDIFDFLGEHQSFRDAFQGVSDKDQKFRIEDVEVVHEEVLEIGDTAYDD